jgi:kynureninase
VTAGRDPVALEPTDRAYALALDAADSLAGLAADFVVPDPDLIYLDGNSLGRLPQRSVTRARAVVEREWGEQLIRSWAHWVGDAERVGDLLGEAMLGAAPGQVLLSDTTTTNLYKLIAAGLAHQRARDPRRTELVTDTGNFPTDRYVVEGVAANHGGTARFIELDELAPVTAADVAAQLDDRTALVVLSLVDYRSAALADLAAVTSAIHEAGALVLWDLCHAAGAVPIALDAGGADLAVGCTYKYLNAGPGAPAFLYVATRLQDELRQPIWGWFGQRDQFGMGQGYDPAPGIRKFATGTPSPLGAALVECGVGMLAEAGIDALRAKGSALTDYLITLHDAWLAPLGFTVASPRGAAERGSHVSLRFADAYRVCTAMIARGIVPDFRAPDRVRLGPAPASTSYVNVYDAMAGIRDIVESGAHLELPTERARVT